MGVIEKMELVVEEQSLAVTDTVDSFQDIHVQVDELLSQVQQVDDNTKMIQRTKDETLMTIQSMAAVSQESVAASENVVNNMKLQADEVGKLLKLSEKLNANATRLEQGVMQFQNEPAIPCR